MPLSQLNMSRLTWPHKSMVCVLVISFGITASIVFVTKMTLYKVNDRVIQSSHVEAVGETAVAENIGDKPITSLIDMPVNFNFSHASRHVKYTILWYNPMIWFQRLKSRLGTCQYNNCKLTYDKRYLKRSAAVIFSINFPMKNTPPVSHSERDPNQIWISFAREPPISHRYFFENEPWTNTMNWTITYSLDSDVTFSYGMFRTRPQPYNSEPDYGRIYDMKTKMAVWVVSHCQTKSRRALFVSALQQAGITVDIFGACGGSGPYKGDIRNLVKPYKFYLSFENSFCKDYITEKAIYRYNDDVLIVVRGGADYIRLIPNDTYVDAAKFPDVTSLAKSLLDLSSNKTRYIEMLRNKYKYQAVGEEFTYPRAMCDLCRKLNHLNESAQKIIFRPDIYNIKEGRCIDPQNIDIK